jgi:hypothetical protein
MIKMLSLITLISICSMHRANPMYRSNRYRYGIDFKNPFTMSNKGASAPICRRTDAPNLWSSSSGKMQGSGGAYRDRTDDLMLAKQPLSQLS